MTHSSIYAASIYLSEMLNIYNQKVYDPEVKNDELVKAMKADYEALCKELDEEGEKC